MSVNVANIVLSLPSWIFRIEIVAFSLLGCSRRLVVLLIVPKIFKFFSKKILNNKWFNDDNSEKLSNLVIK